MISAASVAALAAAAFVPLVAGHGAPWHPSMWGFNVTDQSYSYDNRPENPLIQLPFDKWWFHGHMDHPPHPDDVFELPAGGTANIQIACNKGFTDYFASSPGGDNRKQSDFMCPGQPAERIHAGSPETTTGCGWAVAYKDNAADVQPEDFVIFSTIRQCPWYLNNQIEVPAKMPPCPNGKCTCAFFWIHSPDYGAEEMYMNAFQCRFTGDLGDKPIGKPGLARACGADSNLNKQANPSNCTVGPVNPLYWFQQERNNMFEGTYDAPTYNERYGFPGGAQQNLFQDATVGGAPAPVSAPSNANTNPNPGNNSGNTGNTGGNSNNNGGSTSNNDGAQTSSVQPVSNFNAPSPAPQTTAAPVSVAAPTTPAAVVATPETTSPADSPATTAAAETPAATRKCRRRGEEKKKKKRSAVQRHLKKRLSGHDSL